MSGGGISMGAVPDMLMGKDPKKAILDNMKMAALVGTGMAAAPLLAGTAAAGGTAAGSGLLGGATASAIPAASAVGTPLASAAAGGGLAPTGWAGYMAHAKPFMDAAGTGMSVAGGMNQGEAPTPPPQLPQQMGAQTLQQLAQQSPQVDVMAEAEMRKKRRQGLLGAM